MKMLIIIVFFGNSSDLKNLLEDLKKIDAEICVVSNGEKKDVEFVKKFKNVNLIQNEKNLGFAGGVNRGLGDRHRSLSLQNYDWVWILNPDCRVHKLKIKNYELRISEYDIWSPVIYDANGKVWFAGGKINRWTGEVEISRKVELIPPSHKATADKWVSGCSMFVNPKVFEKIGLFHERFFLFYEDVDFCLRARKAGFTVGMIGEDGIGRVEGLGGLGKLKVTHKVSKSVNQLGGKEKYRIEMKSKWLFLRKHWREFYLSAFVINWMREIKHRLSLRVMSVVE